MVGVIWICVYLGGRPCLAASVMGNGCVLKLATSY
jgi:hypothetical protein